jgi:hypothetical protein
MNNRKIEFLQSILNNKKTLIELIAAAIVIGLGVSFIASGIFDYFNFQNKNLIFLSIGIFLTIIGFGYYLNKLFGRRKFSKKVEGFFILDRKNKKVIDIDNYDYSNSLASNLKYAFKEDKALKKTWKKIDFENIFKKNRKFLEIIDEASEYYLLEKLSTHLSEYFNNTKFDKEELIEYERNDIPDVLLNNRFLELFSKPMDQRESFISDEEIDGVFEIKRDGKKKSVGKVVSNFRNGAMFSHFDLKLPKNSKLKRNSDHSISLVTERFTLNLKTIISGINTYIPHEYERHYLGLNYSSDLPAFVATYEIEVNFHILSLLKTNSWQYYQWVDSFINRIENDVSQDYYFNEKIEWDKTYPIIKMLKQKQEEIKK